MSSQYSGATVTRNSISLANAAAPSIPEPPRRAASARVPQHNIGASRTPSDQGVGAPLQPQAGFLPRIPGARIAGTRSGALGPAQIISESAQSARGRDASPIYSSSSIAAGASTPTQQQSPAVPRSKPRNVLFGGGSSAQRNVASTSGDAMINKGTSSSTPSLIRDGKSIAEDIHAAAHAYFRDRAFEKEQRREAFQRQTRMMLLSKDGEDNREGTMPSPAQGTDGLPSELVEGGERRQTTNITTLVVQDTASPRHAVDGGDARRGSQSDDGALATSYLTLDTHQQRIVLQTAYRSRQALPPSSSTSEKDARVLALASSFNERTRTTRTTNTEADASTSLAMAATTATTTTTSKGQSIAEVMSSVKGYFDDDDFRPPRRGEQERKKARDLGEAPLENLRDTMAPTGFLNPNKLVFLRQRAEELMDEERAAQQARQREALVSEEEEARPVIPQQAERALMTDVASWLKSFPPGHQLEMLTLQQRYFPSALSKPSAGGIGGEGGGRALHGRKAVIVDVPEGAGMRPFRKAAFGSSRRKKSVLRAGGQSRGQGGDGSSSPESTGGLNNKAKAYSPRRRSSATLADIDNFFASIVDDDEDGVGSLLPSIGSKGRKPKSVRRQRPSRNEGDQSGVSDEHTHSQPQPRGDGSKPSKSPTTNPTGGTNTSAAEASPSPSSLLATHGGVHHEMGHPQPQSLAPTSSSARPPEAAVGAHHSAVGRQVREALTRVGVVYDGFTSSSLYSTYGGSSSSAADIERRHLQSFGGSHPSRSDVADTEESGTATASIRRDGAASSLAQLSSDLRAGQVSSSSRAHSLFTTTSVGDALTSYYSMTDIGGDRSLSASRSSPSLRSYSEALSSVSGVARLNLKDDGLDDDAASASNSSRSRSHSRTASVTSAFSPTTSQHIHPPSVKEGDGGTANEDAHATHAQKGHNTPEKTPTRDLTLSTTSKSSPPALKQKDGTPQSASRNQHVGSRHTAAPPLPSGSNAQTTAPPPTAVTIRRNPQAFAVATAAATRVTQETRALITELIELELHSRLVCNWFGSPSPQILQRFGLVTSDVTPLDEALTLREGGVPTSSSSYSSSWPALLRANNNNTSKNSVLERPSWLLRYRLFPRLSSPPPLQSFVPTLTSPPPVLGSSRSAATRESLPTIQSTATASVGEVRRSSNAPPAEAPPTARSVLTSALSTFEFLFEQSFPLLIGAQLGFATDISTVQPDPFAPLSTTADRTRARASRQALVTAIDAYRVADVAAANAQAVSKATGLRKAHVAAQAANSSAVLAAQTVGRMLEALLPPFLRPEQQEKHMILLPEASSRTRNGPRGRHTKSSAHLRPNPLLSLADVFMGNLASDLAGLHDTLNKGNSSMSDRGHALANAGERTGLATRPHGEAGHGGTAAQRGSRLHLIQLGESYRRAQKRNENTFGGPREVERPPLYAIRFVVELLATEFKHASPAGIASLPLLMPGLPSTLWDVHEAQYSSLLDQLESVVGGIILKIKGPSDSVAEPVATFPSEDTTTVSTTGSTFLTCEELVRLDAALNASFLQSAPATCIPSLTARLLVSLREEQSCRESLSWLLDLCDVVVTRRHEAAATKLKRLAIEDGSFLPTTNSHQPPSHGKTYTTFPFPSQRVTSVALGANVEILANSSLVDAVLTNASADLFYSAMNKARLALASGAKMVSDEESDLQDDNSHYLTSESQHRECEQPHYGNSAYPDAAKEGPFVLSLLDPSAYPLEVTRSSLVQFLQLFNSYSPQGNSWIRSASYSSEELKALHMVAARAHVAGLFLPPTSTLSTLSSKSSPAHECGGFSFGLLPFVTSPLSFSIPAIVSALFSADDAYQDLNSIQKRIESFTVQHSDYNRRVDELSEAISALNFQVLLSQQNIPISSVAAAAARRMSVMSSTSEGPAAEERSRSRSSFSQFPSIVNDPHTSAIFERIVELEREREAVLADIKVIVLQSSAVAEDRQKALDSLCRSQATALMSCCVEAAVSALCVPLDKEITIKVPDVADLLTADEEANKRRREELVVKIGIGQTPKRVAGVLPPPPPSLADLTVCLPPQLHLTPLLCGQQQTHRAPDASSGERKTCVSLPPRTWCAHEYLLPYNRAYLSSEVQRYREKRGSSANGDGGGRNEYASSSPTRGDPQNYNNNNSNNNAMALGKHLPSERTSAPLKGVRTKKLVTALASWLSEVDANAPEEDDELGSDQARIIVDGLVSGAVVVAYQEYRASVAFGLNEGLGGGGKYSKDVEAQVIAAHAPRLPMVPLETTYLTTSPFPTVMRGIRVNFLFAWRVAGLVMRIVACRLMPVVYKVRRHHYRLSLQPRAAFIIQCAYRRLLQSRRIRARAAVRRIERFLYSKIQVILARKARAHGVLRRAMRLWLMRKEARARVGASLALMRDEVIRRRMQCMHANKILTQLQRLQEERTVLVHRCALQAHRILSDERNEWRRLCETIRKAFFEELAELLANQTERECLRVLVGAEDADEDEGADWFRRMSHSQSQRSPSLTNHNLHHNIPPPCYTYHEGIHSSSPSDEPKVVGQLHDSTRPLPITLIVDKPTSDSQQIDVIGKGEDQEDEGEDDADVSPLLPPEHMRRSSDAAFAFFQEYGRRLSLAQSHTIDDRQSGQGYQHGGASSGSSRSLQLAGSDHAVPLPPPSMRRVSKKRNSQIALNTLVDALNPQHRRSIMDLLGSSSSAAPLPQLADRRSSLAVAEQSITAWRKSRVNSIFALDASRRASYQLHDHNVSVGQLSSSTRLTSPPTISLQTAQNTPPPSASLLGVPGDSSDPRRPPADLMSLAAIKLLKGHSRLPRFSVVDTSAMSPSRAMEDDHTEGGINGESNGMLVVRPQSQTTYTSTSRATSSALRGANIVAAPHGSFSYRGAPRLQTSAKTSTNNAHSSHSHTMHIVAGPIILKHFKPLTLHEHTDTAEYVREIFFAPQVVNVETLRRRRRQNPLSSALEAPPAVATTSVTNPQDEKAAAITNAALAIRGPTAACTFDDDDDRFPNRDHPPDATSALLLELSGDLGPQHGSTGGARRGTAALKGGGFASTSQYQDTGLPAAAFNAGSSALSFDAVTVCRSLLFPSQQALEDVDPFSDYAKEVRTLCGRPLPPRPDPPREISQLPSRPCRQLPQVADTNTKRTAHSHAGATSTHRRGHSQSVFRKVHKWCPSEEYDGIHRPPVLPWDCSRRPYATPTTGVGRFWLSLCSNVPLRHHRALGFKLLHFVESLHPSLFYPLCPRPFFTTDQNDFSLLQEASSATFLSLHDGGTAVQQLDSAAASTSMKLSAPGPSQSTPLAVARRMTTAARFSIRARRESTKFGRDNDATDVEGGRTQRHSVAGLSIANVSVTSILFPFVFSLSQQDVRTDLDEAFPLNSAFGTLIGGGSLGVVGARVGKSSLSPPPLLSMSDARAGLTELLMPALSLETSATGGSQPRIERLLSSDLGVGAFALTAKLAVEGYCRTALLCLKIASVYATVEDAGRVRARDDIFEAVSMLWGLNGMQRQGQRGGLLGSSSSVGPLGGVIESTTMEALRTLGASARATLQQFVAGAMQHAAMLLRTGGHDSVIVDCIESVSSTLVGAASLGRLGVNPSQHQQRSTPSMFDIFVNNDEGGADGITDRDLERALSRLRASVSAMPLQLVLPDGFRLRNNVTTQALQGLGIGQGRKGIILPLLSYDYIPLTSSGLRSAPPNLWGGLMLLFGGADAAVHAVATEGGLSPHRSTRLMRMKSKSKRSFRRLPVSSSTTATNIHRGEEERVWPHAASVREASSRGAASSNRTAVVQIGGSNESVVDDAVTGRGRGGTADADMVLEIRGIDASPPDTSPSDTISLLNVRRAGEGGESGDDEVASAFCELLETTERIQRKQLATEFFRILTSIHDHIRWHMAALYLMENTRFELVPAVTDSNGGGRTEGVDGSQTNYKLRRVGDWSMRSGLGAFSGSLVIKTLTGIHPIFAEGGVIRSLRPMWVLQKGFALLQEEYAQRCAIIVEYEHTPLFTLNHTKIGFASTDSDFKGFSRFANVRERTKSVIEPRRPSHAPPAGIANGGEPAPFRGRRTSVIVAETGERRVSLLAADGQHIGTSTARRDTIRVDVGGGGGTSPNGSTTVNNRALPPRRRQSVASTGTAATELSSRGGGKENGKDKEQAPTLPHVPSDRVYRPGVSSVRPYLSMRPKDGLGRSPYSPSSSSGKDQSEWGGRDGGEGSDNEHSGAADSSTVDPFEKFGSEGFGASSSSGHGRARPPPLGDMLRRRSTVEEKNDEYQRRLSLMSDVPMPANRRGTLQYTEEAMSLIPGEERERTNEELRTRSGRRRSKHGKRATIRSGSMVNAHANDDNDERRGEGASTPDRPRFSISGNHHPFASILHQQVSGVSPIDSPREGAMSDSGASTPRSSHSRNPSVGNTTDGHAGGRGGSVNSLLFASQSRAHQQPLASGGTLSPSSFYAPASANIVIPSVRSRRMTTAEAELLFPARSPSASAVFVSLSEANSPGTPAIAIATFSGVSAPPPPSILKSPTDKQQPALASASGRTNPLRSNSSSEVSLTARSSATVMTSNGSPRGSGGERVSVNGASGSPFTSTQGYQRSPTGLKVASLGTRESLHEHLRNFKFRDSLAYPQPLDLGPRHAEGVAGGHEGTIIEGLGGGSEQTSARGPSIDLSRLSVNSNYAFGARDSVLTPASPSSSTRMSLEEDQLNAVARSGKDYEANSSKAPRRLTISRPSGML